MLEYFSQFLGGSSIFLKEYSIKIIICFKIQMVFVDDWHSPERVCAISGSPDKVQIAAQMIQHLLIEYNASDIYMYI